MARRDRSAGAWGSIATIDDVRRVLIQQDQQIERLYEAINKIDLRGPTTAILTDGEKPQNLDARLVVYVSNATGVDQPMQHKLGRIPVGLVRVYLPGVNSPGEVFFGSLAPDAQRLVVRCTGLSIRVAILIF